MGKIHNATGRSFGHFGSAAKSLGIIAVGLLLIAGGRQDAEADLIIDFWDNGGDLYARYSGDLSGQFLTTAVFAFPGTVAIDQLDPTNSGGLRHFRGGNSLEDSSRGVYEVFTPQVSNFMDPAGPFQLFSGPTITPLFFPNTRRIDIALRQDSNALQAELKIWGFPLTTESDSWGVGFNGAIFDTGLASSAILAFDDSLRHFAFPGLNDDVTINLNSGTPPLAVIPEPSSILALLGVVTGTFFRRRRRLLA